MRCLIVEDQEPARRLLKHYISKLNHLVLVNACSSASEALAILGRESVDVLFLDLHLPQMDGLSFLRGLERPPKIIVTTAYAEYALEAFDLDVVDYLLKPFEFERFCRAVARAQNQKSGSEETHLQTKFIKVGRESIRIKLCEIVYIESDGNFLYLVMTTNQRYHILGTLQQWEAILAEQAFVRTHRSYLVNSQCITKVTTSGIETSAGLVPIGRSYKRTISEQLEL